MTAPRRKRAGSAEAATAPGGPDAPQTAGPGGGASIVPIPATQPPGAAPGDEPQHQQPPVDLSQRRDELTARFAELQCDLGGLTYEMAIRNHIRVEVLVRKAAILQDVDAELGEVERILRMEETGAAGSCASCGAPHSGGAVYCWQCGQPLLEHVSSHTISI
jgi:hypothetical protein